jgi:uncharacterized protein YjbI with pentapeptide repeats
VARPSRTPSPPEAPRLEDDLEDLELDADALSAGASVEDADVSGADLTGVHARGVTVAHARTSTSAARNSAA